MKNAINLRAKAATLLYQVMEEGQSLSTCLPQVQSDLSSKDKGLLAELCYGVLRTLPEQDYVIHRLMRTPFTGKNRSLHYLLLVGLYQLIHTRIPPHAAIAETVEGAKSLQKPGLKNVINGVLRQFQRNQQTLLEDFAKNGDLSLHPRWLHDRITQAYPKESRTIIEANNQKAPMWIRVNPRYHDTSSYLAILAENNMEAYNDKTFPQAIRLEKPVSVHSLPGFEEGWVTVQDCSAQKAATLLAPQSGDVILDLCAAPGGKTTHILELAPEATVLAVDNDPNRLGRVQENLERLKQTAEIISGDGRHPELWAENLQFDRILVDTPCSATGVIRRHPDIKWLRRDSDIASLTQLQHEILTAIWPYLKVGGILVYSTCSILPEENQSQIDHFLKKTSDASLDKASIQYLPTPLGGDGFFYAILKKNGV